MFEPRLRTVISYLFFIAVGLIAVVPLLHASSRGVWFPNLSVHTVAALNLLGWALVLMFLYSREVLHRTAGKIARRFGIDQQLFSFETLLVSLLREVDRKYSALSLNLVENKISSREQLAESLERVVRSAYELFDAESAELSLFDKDTGLFHSSFVVGRPGRQGSQSISGPTDTEIIRLADSDVMIQPIAFAGQVMGSLRVTLKRGSLPSVADREVLKLLAIHGSVAILNAQFTGELMRLHRASDESIKAKTGFLANLSHEIRGPLSIIMNAAELVLEGLCGPVTIDQKDTIQMVKKNGEHLLDLINDVLDYAKIESGKISADPVEIAIDELLEEMTYTLRVEAQAKGHVLEFRPCAEALAIRCDRRHARQILMNLLTNAIKYTKQGGVIELWAERNASNRIKVNVRDNGVGIEAREREKVFAPFERLENSYSLAQVGTGLGMPLTKRLVEINTGSIDFTSVVGQGSHFWVLLPAVEFSPFASAKISELPAVASGRGEKILFAATAQDERGMVSRYLRHLGFAITEVVQIDEVKVLVQQGNWDLVILDSGTSDGSDANFIRTIRSHSKHKALKIAILSSRAFAFDVEKYLLAGVDRCIAKPVSLRDLGIICREILDTDLNDKNAAQGIGACQTKAIAAKVKQDDVMH